MYLMGGGPEEIKTTAAVISLSPEDALRIAGAKAAKRRWKHTVGEETSDSDVYYE